MTERKPERLNRLARKFNVGIQTLVEFLNKKGVTIDSNPNTKVPGEYLSVLEKEYSSHIQTKQESQSSRKPKSKKETISIEDVKDTPVEPKPAEEEKTVLVKDLSSKSDKPVDTTKIEDKKSPQLKVVGKVELKDLKKGTKKELEVKQVDNKKDTPKKIASEKTEKKTENKVQENTTSPTKVEKTAQDTKTPSPSVNDTVQSPPADEKPKAEENKNVVKEETVTEKTEDSGLFKSEVQKLSGPRVVGKIELPVETKKSPNKDSKENDKRNRNKRKRRKRIKDTPVKTDGKGTPSTRTPNDKAGSDTKGKPGETKPRTPGDRPRPAGGRPFANRQGGNDRPRGRNDQRRPISRRPSERAKPDEEDVQKQVKETLARLTNKKKSTTAKHRRQKRDDYRQRQEIEQQEASELARTTLQVTEFMTVAELANMMDLSVTEVIKNCMELGMFVSINQRLDAETISLVAESFGYKSEFQDAEDATTVEVEEDKEEDLIARPPIVTVMGHVDHGKTSLLDYVRKANVISDEAGGITQHIGAYSVTLKSGQKITFLDTPGHEAFTAMRARGAKVTDVAIIVVAADDSVMPQTIEAINHASAAGVPIVFAINKIDKDGANPDRIRQQLADMNFVVEEWGGKYQAKEISAKHGQNIEELLELVLLEAELLDLKANPEKNANGSIVESSLDRGRGYVATVLVDGGTLKVGDYMLAGTYTGKVKAMFNERNERIEVAYPGEPAVILGLNGAPQAGDSFHVLSSEREAKEIANKREQLKRELSIRTQKHVTLDEIGRRIAIGNFHELNVIVKGDVDGSIEALSDSLIKLSTEEIQVNVIHKAVGQISESDVMLATASDAIIIGFQVRPSISARRIAEKEHIDIRLYSVIYDAIDEIKDAMQGMLSPELKEEIVASLEIRETFKISKIGMIAGCMVKEGKINRNTKVRVIRDGIVVHTGNISALKRFKDDVKEVARGFECGLSVEKFYDLKEGDIIEGFEQKEVQKKL